MTCWAGGSGGTTACRFTSPRALGESAEQARNGVAGTNRPSQFCDRGPTPRGVADSAPRSARARSRIALGHLAQQRPWAPERESGRKSGFALGQSVRRRREIQAKGPSSVGRLPRPGPGRRVFPGVLPRRDRRREHFGRRFLGTVIGRIDRERCACGNSTFRPESQPGEASLERDPEAHALGCRRLQHRARCVDDRSR
jgi:hypothetical protein